MPTTAEPWKHEIGLPAGSVRMLPPVVVSLPFKLIFFVLVDGWSLVAGSLVQSYGT